MNKNKKWIKRRRKGREKELGTPAKSCSQPPIVPQGVGRYTEDSFKTAFVLMLPPSL